MRIPPFLPQLTQKENVNLLTNACLTQAGNAIETSLPIIAIKVEEQKCVALPDPTANTVIISEELISRIKHKVVTQSASITINTTNGSLTSPGLVASVHLSSIDDSFKIEVKTLTSPSSIVSLKTKSVTAKQLRIIWPRISKQAITDITNLHNGKEHEIDVLLSTAVFWSTHERNSHVDSANGSGVQKPNNFLENTQPSRPLSI